MGRKSGPARKLFWSFRGAGVCTFRIKKKLTTNEEDIMKKLFSVSKNIVFLYLVMSVAFSIGIGSMAFAADTVKIGLISIFSGPAEIAGRGNETSIQFAIDEQNAKGGLLGKKIELLIEDSELKADVGLRKEGSSSSKTR
jgi:ABC-type branched-subunit amino acid transport system substrate-binding protein